MRSFSERGVSANARRAHAHWQVSQPFASFLVPFGHWGSQPSAGQATPVVPPEGGAGGVQPPVEPVPQSQLQGGQVSPGAHDAQPQAQPPPLDPVPPPPLGGAADWHTPETQVCPVMQGAPIAYHMHEFAVQVV